MRILIIMCMIISLLITPWSLVYGAAGAIMGVTGAVAALMQAYGYVTSVTGETYDAQDVSAGIGDMMEAYAAHLGTTVSALFPASSILFTAGSTVLKYSADIVQSVQGMIEYFSSNGELDYSIASSETVTFGPGTVYKLPYTFTTVTGNKLTVSYIGGAPQSSVYMCIAKHPSWGYYIEVDDYSCTSGGNVHVVSSGPDNGSFDLYVSVRGSGASQYIEYYRDFDYTYGAPKDMYLYSTSTFPPDALAHYYYSGNIEETMASIVITGSDALPDTSEDTSLMIPGIGTAGTLDTAGEQILDMVVEGALDIVTQLPEGDPISPDLFDVFPFCLPYDMYRLLHVFDAEPEAPVIHWPIKVDSIGVDEELVIDLSEWDSVASLVRHLETIVFLVGLALITRKWIGAE